MGHFKNEVISNKEIIQYRYEGVEMEQAQSLVENIFLNSGYQAIPGAGGHRTFEKGNRTMRILFGAFIKYYKFAVIPEKSDDGIDVKVVRATTGMSGGLIGANQVTDEMIRIAREMKAV